MFNINNEENILSFEEIEFYKRQMLIPFVGLEGQNKLKKTKVLCIGAGGIGSSTLMYLAGAGIGKIGVVDCDTVDISNLHRQVIHKFSDKNKKKVDSASKFLKELNPFIEIEPYYCLLNKNNSEELFKNYDYVIDGSDNALTRYIINDTCCILNKTLISASAIKTEAQLTIYNYKDGPCYRCIFPECPKSSHMMSCNENGVIGTVPGLIGLQAVNELIKLVCNKGNLWFKKMFIYDCLTLNIKSIKIRSKNKDCIMCNPENRIINSIKEYDYNDFVGESCEIMKNSKINIISWNDILENKTIKLKNNELLIDVREENLFNIINLNKFENSIHIPIYKILNYNWKELFEKFNITKDRKIYVYCQRGITSKEVYIYLKNIGLDVYHIENGINSLCDIFKIPNLIN